MSVADEVRVLRSLERLAGQADLLTEARARIRFAHTRAAAHLAKSDPEAGRKALAADLATLVRWADREAENIGLSWSREREAIIGEPEGTA